MNVLELIEDYLLDKSIDIYKKEISHYYIALKNLNNKFPQHDIFKLELNELQFIEKAFSFNDIEHIELESSNDSTEYKLYLDWIGVWDISDDLIEVPLIRLEKIETLLHYQFSGSYSELESMNEQLDKLINHHDILNLDNIHKLALIEYHERELKKLY